MIHTRKLTAVLLAVVVAFMCVQTKAATDIFTYDELGRMVAIDHGGSNYTTYALDAVGNRKVVKSGNDTTNPTKPTNFAVSAPTSNLVNLTWTASTDTNGSGVAGYHVERCTGTACSNYTEIGLAAAIAVSFGDTTVSGTTTYRYRVRAYDVVANNGLNSTVVAVTTPDSLVPSTPTNLVATAPTMTTVSLSWTASTDTGGSGLTGYKVERCTYAGGTCGAFAQIGTSASPSYADSGLSGTTTYGYKVRAYDGAANNSGYSNTATVTTPDTAAPSAPSGLSATASGATTVNLSWTAATDTGGSGVALYRIERCTGAGCSTYAEIATSTTTSYSNTGVNQPGSYTYRVRAQDGASNLGGYSNTATVSVTGVIPAAPTTSSSAAIITAGGSYTISWTAVSGATFYELYQSTAGAGGAFSLNYSGSALLKVFSSAVAGEYAYRTKACNSLGCSGNSNTKLVTVCPVGGCQ